MSTLIPTTSTPDRYVAADRATEAAHEAADAAWWRSAAGGTALVAHLAELTPAAEPEGPTRYAAVTPREVLAHGLDTADEAFRAAHVAAADQLRRSGAALLRRADGSRDLAASLAEMLEGLRVVAYVGDADALFRRCSEVVL